MSNQGTGEYRDHVPRSHLVLFSLSLEHRWNGAVVLVTVCMSVTAGISGKKELQIRACLHLVSHLFIHTSPRCPADNLFSDFVTSVNIPHTVRQSKCLRAGCTYPAIGSGLGFWHTLSKTTTMSCIDDIFYLKVIVRDTLGHVFWPKICAEMCPGPPWQVVGKLWLDHNPSWWLFTLVFRAVHLWSDQGF